MKNIITTLGLFFISANLMAQIGINYNPSEHEYQPKSPFVIVGDATAPQNALRFNIPSQEIKKGLVLVSDEHGNVRWDNLSNSNLGSVNGIYSDLGLDKELEMQFENRITPSYYTGANIALPHGIWNVNFDFKIKIKKRVRLTEDEIVFTNFRTENKLTESQFYNEKFQVSNASGSYNFDANNGDDFRAKTDCETRRRVERCYYYFTKKEVKTKGSYAWMPIDRDEAFWVRLILSDDATTEGLYNTNYTKDVYIPSLFLASGDINGVINMTSVRGQIYINNVQTEAKKYYLKISIEGHNFDPQAQYKIENFAAGPMLTDYDRFFALPVNK